MLASVALALVAQAWILPLPARLDDFALLRDPGGLWAEFADLARREEGPRATFFRPALWSLWWLVRALFGEPVRAWPYLAAGWLVHGLAAGAVALAVGRAAGARAAFLAGAFAGTAAGGIQAVAWIAAQGDLLVGAGAAAAVALFVGKRPWLALVPLGVALLAKFTGVVAAGAAVLLAYGLAASSAPSRGSDSSSAGARPVARAAAVASASPEPPAAARLTVGARRFALGAACAVALVLAARFVFVGALDVAYGVPSPELPSTLEGLRGPAGALAQALVPLERDPGFADVAPAAERLLGARAHAAGLLVLLPLVAAAAAVPAARRRLALLVLVAGILLLPAGAMHAGLGTNHQARHVYPALLALGASLGVALDALLARRRVLGTVLGLLAAAVTADGLVHVARVERAGGRVFAASHAALVAAADEHAASGAARPLDVFLLRGREGPGSIRAGTARAFDAALAPPFRTGSAARVHGVRDRADLQARLAGLELAGLDAVVFGPAPESMTAPLLRGAARRAQLVLRRWTPIARGLADSSRASDVACRLEELPEVTRVHVGAPGTAARVVALRFPGGAASDLRVTPTYAEPDRAHVVHLPAAAGERHVAFALAPEIARGFTPLAFVDVAGARPEAARLLDAPAACGLELADRAPDPAAPERDPPTRLAPGPEAPLALHRGPPFVLDPATPLALRLTLPPEARGATRARFDVRLRPPPERWPFSADVELAGHGAAHELRLDHVHTDPARDGPPRSVYPWAVAVEDVILPLLRAARIDAGVLSVRARVLHASGLEAARSAWVSVPYRAR